jgi:DNA-binding CsgD family transcriptional regulator
VLGRLAPYAAAAISSFDPIAGAHRTLANDGYTPEVLGFLEGDFVERDIGYARCRVFRTPLRVDDAPGDYRDSPGFQRVLGPAGFGDGMTACLFTGDGRYTGMLNLSTERRGGANDLARDVVHATSSLLATVADATRTPARLATALDPDAAAIGLADDRLLRLPGRAVSDVLLHEPDLHAAARAALRGERDLARFLWRDAVDAWHRVIAVRAGAPAPGARPVTVLLERPSAIPHGLTSRELEVLTLLAEGATNVQIAAMLVTARATIATHVEHILAKLACENRAAAAARATADGLVLLRVPRYGSAAPRRREDPSDDG